MVSTEKNFDTLATLYRRLIYQTMRLHNIKEIRCENKKEHFFDRLVMSEEGKLEIWKYKLKWPMKKLSFDHTVDYATCLSYIEHDLYLAQRNGSPERGMLITFHKDKAGRRSLQKTVQDDALDGMEILTEY
jgi:hypothetical protein